MTNETIRNLLSRPSTQPVLLQLLKLCHAGLNYGGGQSVAKSGEMAALRSAYQSLRHSQPFVLFDVGANDGEYMGVALGAIGKDIQVFSFEPQSSSFEILTSRYSADSRVHLRKMAVGKEESTANLFFSRDVESTASLHRTAIPGEAYSELVRLTTIDQICSEEGVEHIDFLKIDTEGHEIEVLLGARQMIGAGRISSIQFEFGDTFLNTTYHFRDCWELLRPQYRFYRILRRGLVPVTRYSCDLEIYKTANYFCVREN